MVLSLETLVAILGALGVGALGVKLLERVFSRQDKRESGDATVLVRQIDAAAEMRQKLWDRVAVLECQVKTLTDELDKWKRSYWEREEELSELHKGMKGLEDNMSHISALKPPKSRKTETHTVEEEETR